jgi:hypothetical protein
MLQARKCRRMKHLRTVKPCGPDAPRAGVKSERSESFSEAMVSKSRSPGRARHKPSNHCAGKAGLPPPNLSARVRIPLLPHAHETAGAARTRSSLRPLLRVACALFSRRSRTKLDASDKTMSRECESVCGASFETRARACSSESDSKRRLGRILKAWRGVGLEA